MASTTARTTKAAGKKVLTAPAPDAVVEQPAAGWEPGKGHILEVKAGNPKPFHLLFEALKAVLFEANLVFSESGLRMAAIDGKRNVLAHLTMPVSSFEQFHCKERMALGVDIALLQKIMRTAKMGDQLSFTVHEDSPDILGIWFKNPEKGMECFHPLKLKFLPDYNVKESITFKEPPPQMVSAEFQAIVRDMIWVGATIVEIQYLDDKVTFMARDGPDRSRYTQKLQRPELQDTTRPEKVPELARGVFILKHLQSFTKATPLSSHVHLYLHTTSPLLICEYNVQKLGSLKYCLEGKKE